MDRDAAYSLLARELGRFRRLPRPDLVRCIDGPVIERTEWVDSQPLAIKIHVQWANAEAGTIRIRATANGPSWWRLERLEESVLVGLPALGEQGPS